MNGLEPVGFGNSVTVGVRETSETDAHHCHLLECLWFVLVVNGVVICPHNGHLLIKRFKDWELEWVCSMVDMDDIMVVDAGAGQLQLRDVMVGTLVGKVPNIKLAEGGRAALDQLGGCFTASCSVESNFVAEAVQLFGYPVDYSLGTAILLRRYGLKERGDEGDLHDVDVIVKA